MDVFRITQVPYTDLRGDGGLYASGRWHRRGHRVVYTADCSAPSILERLVHTDPEDVPEDLVLLRIQIPDDLRVDEVRPAELPDDWRTLLHPACIARGERWLAASQSAILRTPSVVAPDAHVLVLNPAHPDASRIRIHSQTPFTFDPRLVDPAGR